MTISLTASSILPQDPQRVALIGRVWQPGVGPVLMAVAGDTLHGVALGFEAGREITKQKGL